MRRAVGPAQVIFQGADISSAGEVRELERRVREYRSRKIALSGGREIEVVYFADPDDAHSGAAWEADASFGDVHTHAVSTELHICPECAGDMVYPVEWSEVDGDWTILRRCPECEWMHEGRFTQDEAEDFDDALTDASEEMLCALRTTSRRNMRDDVERIIAALHDDLILPMDF